MKKEQIYVVIDSEEKRLRAIQILTDAKESMSKDQEAYEIRDNYKFLRFNRSCVWYIHSYLENNETEITLNQLEQLLNPNFVAKEVHLTIDELQKQAESLGFELVKKERQIKVGDFGKFWDNDINDYACGFLFSIIDNSYKYRCKSSSVFKNFAHLTDEEKQQIKENW